MAKLLAALCFELPAVQAGAPVPDWVELIPAPGPDGLIQGIDGRAWKMDAAAVAGRKPHVLAIDINHSTERAAPLGQPSPAVGWIEELQARDAALWGRVRWLTEGVNAVSGQQYRYLSPVFLHDAQGRIHRLKTASLTNTPNFTLALNSAEDPETDMTIAAAILAALSLSADAGEADAVAAIDKLKGSLHTAENSAAERTNLTLYIPRADYDQVLQRAENAEQTLKQREKADHSAKVEIAIQGALSAGKIAPSSVEYYRTACNAEGGLQAFEKFVAGTAPIVDPSKPDPTKPASMSTALNAEEKATCAAMGITEEKYVAERDSLRAAGLIR